MFKDCEMSEHKAIEKEGLERCPRCGVRVRTVVPYEDFKIAKRNKKYGSPKQRVNRLKAKGYPDDFTFGTDEH